MNDSQFLERIQLILDPYFDREFFTNLIHCMDRKKQPRDIFLAVTKEISTWSENGMTFDEDLDEAVFHLYASFQASSNLRASYQWLPLAQGLYTLSLFRSEGRKPLPLYDYQKPEGRGCEVDDFRRLIRQESRNVESQTAAWESFLFLLEGRTTRAGAVSALVSQALIEGDTLTAALMMKAVDVAFACGWSANDTILRRPFDRFWEEGKSAKTAEAVLKGFRLQKASELELKLVSTTEWKSEWTEDVWNRIRTQSAEAAWERMQQIAKEGASYDQLQTLLMLLRGRCLYTMKAEQWPLVVESLIYSSALSGVTRWLPQERASYLAADLCDLVPVAQVAGSEVTSRPDGKEIEDEATENISKERLVLRLDDAVERGEEAEALAVLSAILKNLGLSHSVSDRLLLMGAKQDGWTFDKTSIPATLALTSAYQNAVRLQLDESVCADALYGLLRLLTDRRVVAIEEYKRTGTYGDGVSKSQYDVSEGARILDRFVFNQMRNAQRLKVWPTDD